MSDIFQRLSRVVRSELNRKLDDFREDQSTSEEETADWEGLHPRFRPQQNMTRSARGAARDMGAEPMSLSEALQLLKYGTRQELTGALITLDDRYWQEVAPLYRRSFGTSLEQMVEVEKELDRYRKAYYLLEQAWERSE